MKEKRNKGFTLVELIVSIALLGLAMGPLMGTFMNSIRMNSSSRAMLKATTLCEMLMERANQYVYDEIDEAKTEEENRIKELLPASIPSLEEWAITRSADASVGMVIRKSCTYQDVPLTFVITIRDERTGAASSTDRYFVYTVEIKVYRYGTTSNPLATMKGSMMNQR